MKAGLCPTGFCDCYECEHHDPSDGGCLFEENEEKADLKRKYGDK